MEKDKQRIQMLDFSKKLVDFQYALTTTNKSQKWAYYGKDNKLPFYLMQLLKDSPTHSGIVKNKHKFMKGEGFIDNFITNEITGETLYELYDKLALDYMIYGGFSIRIVEFKNKNQLYHVDFGKIRVGVVEGFNEVDTYYYSNDWTKKNNPEVVEFTKFGNKTKDSKLGTLLHYYDYNSLNEYYPIPDYFGAVKSIMGEIEAQNYLTSVMDNSYMPRNIIKFKQTFAPDGERMLLNKMDSNFKGIENAGRPIVLTNMQDVDSVTVEQLDYSMLDPNFAVIDETLTQKIISAHRIPRQLATLNNPSGLSNNGEELRVAFEVFNKTVIEDNQNKLIGTLTKLTNKEIVISPLDLIKTQLSEQTLATILTPEELRKLYGYDNI